MNFTLWQRQDTSICEQHPHSAAKPLGYHKWPLLFGSLCLTIDSRYLIAKVVASTLPIASAFQTAYFCFSQIAASSCQELKYTYTFFFPEGQCAHIKISGSIMIRYRENCVGANYQSLLHGHYRNRGKCI